MVPHFQMYNSKFIQYSDMENLWVKEGLNSPPHVNGSNHLTTPWCPTFNISKFISNFAMEKIITFVNIFVFVIVDTGQQQQQTTESTPINYPFYPFLPPQFIVESEPGFLCGM